MLRSAELHDGALIAYSLGNFAGWDDFLLDGILSENGLLVVELGADGAVLGGRLVPLTLTGPGIPVPDPTGSAIETINELSAADFGEEGFRLRRDGSF